MESEGARDQGSSPPPKPSKFSVYQNAALSAALTCESLRPSNYALLCIFSFSSASAFALLVVISRENGFIDNLKLKSLSHETAYLCAKAIQTVVGLVFFGTVFSIFKAISLQRRRNITGSVLSSSKGNKEQTHLTNHQLGLLGIKPKVEQVVSESSKRPPKSRPHLTPSSDVLVPLHQPMTSPNRSSRTSTDRSNSSGGNRMRAVSTPSKSPSSSSSLYTVSGAVLRLPSVQSSPGVDSVLSTPWSSKRASSGKEITSEEKLEKFLAEVDEKITESAGKMATPPPTIGGFGIGKMLFPLQLIPQELLGALH